MSKLTEHLKILFAELVFVRYQINLIVFHHCLFYVYISCFLLPSLESIKNDSLTTPSPGTNLLCFCIVCGQVEVVNFDTTSFVIDIFP